MLWLNLLTLVSFHGGLAALLRTVFGRALLGIHATEHRMGSMDFDVRSLKLCAFVLAGAMAGVAGHMATMTEAFVNPELLGCQRSAEGPLGILRGGMLFLHVPIVGAVAFVMIGELAGRSTERIHGVEGLVILLAVLALPQGLAGLPEECDPWMTAPIPDALALQRPLEDGLLSVVARGAKQDPPASPAEAQATLLL